MDTNRFIKRLTEIVEEYISDEEAYSDDVQLEVNTQTWDMEIADPDNDIPSCDYWPMMDLVRMSSGNAGQWEPDPEAIAEVAAEYVFTE